MSQYSSIATPTENARVEVSSDGGSTWEFIPGTASITESGGEAPTREQVTFENVSQITGKPRPSTISMTIAGYAALHAVYTTLRNAYIAGTVLRFRYTFQEQEILAVTGAANTVAIASADGAVTFAGTSMPDFTGQEFGPGVALKIGASNPTYHIIKTIDSDGDVVVDPAPAANLAATQTYAVVVPPVRRPSFPAKVSSFDNIEAGSEAQLGTTLGLAPIAALPRFVVAT